MSTPEAPDQFGCFPAKCRYGSAWPRKPRDRGNWQVGQGYAPGDVVDFPITNAGERWLCIGDHVSSPESEPALCEALWERYDGASDHDQG